MLGRPPLTAADQADFAKLQRQMRITPAAEVEVLSTHDQLLGGRMGMSFLGSVFPADPAYSRAITRGGTTAPYLTLEFLTEGRYDADTGQFLARDGKPKFCVASDHVESERYRTLAPADLFDIVMRHELHFSAATETGVVFHMLAALSERGTMGLTAVGDSPKQARALFGRTVATLDEETAELAD